MFKPLRDKLFVKRIDDDESEDIIIIPDSAKEKPVIGEILALGNYVYDEDLQVGDTILFSKYSGADVEIDEEEYLIISEDEILGVIEDES